MNFRWHVVLVYTRNPTSSFLSILNDEPINIEAHNLLNFRWHVACISSHLVYARRLAFGRPDEDTAYIYDLRQTKATVR